MGSSSQHAYGGEGGGGWMNLDPFKLLIAEEDPSHPEHASHVERTRIDHPDMILLGESIRTNGTNESTIRVYLDGGKPTVAEGRRRVVMTRTIIEERKAAKDKRPHLTLRGEITKDPILARNIGNACRAPDPPMVVARRYVEARDLSGDARKAAAQLGLALDYAEQLAKCMLLPGDIQIKINRLELPVDVALRAGKDGSKAVREKVATATDKKTGKVDVAKVERVAAPRLSTRLLRGIAKEVQEMPVATTKDGLTAQIAELKALFDFMSGNRAALDSVPDAHSLALRAGWRLSGTEAAE